MLILLHQHPPRLFLILLCFLSLRLHFFAFQGIKLCSNSLIYLPKFANLDFLEDTIPDATLKNVILRF